MEVLTSDRGFDGAPKGDSLNNRSLSGFEGVYGEIPLPSGDIHAQPV